MDRDDALERLAGTYARALRLEDSGSGTAEIARELGIDPASVGPLLAIGHQKLRHLMGGDPAPAEPGEEPEPEPGSSPP